MLKRFDPIERINEILMVKRVVKAEVLGRKTRADINLCG